MSAPLQRALVTGISGQDGALLAAQLLAAGVDVVGTHRPGRAIDPWRLHGLGIAAHPHLRLAALDTTDAAACAAMVEGTAPDALFHLAGQSRVAESFRDPRGSLAANGASTVNLLEALRAHAPATRFVLASSAEIFGSPQQAPQDEATPLAARTPYGVSKLLAHAAVGAWRASYGLHASSAMRANDVILGNLDARRDFGYAPDHVAAMVAMTGCETQGDYVLATGAGSSIRDFAGAAFAAAGIVLDWFGEGADEVGVEHGSDRVRVRVDAALFRPVDAPLLVGDASKARRDLGFAPSLDLAGLARRMVEADLARERAAA